MDALKSAGRAIIRTPSKAKQWSGSRHKKLPENWTDTKETLLEGMAFSLKYLGMTLVEEPKGEDMAAMAVKRIVVMAKGSSKKLRKVMLTVSPKGILLQDLETHELIESISIFRISYCTADKVYDKVFAYVAQSVHSETLECHAFLSSKKKVAQAVTLTVAQAFRVAFEFWQTAKEAKSQKQVMHSQEKEKVQIAVSALINENVVEVPYSPPLALLDLDDRTMAAPPHVQSGNPFLQLTGSLGNNNVVEIDDDLDEAFAKLAHSRTNPQCLDIGVSPSDLQSEDDLSPVRDHRVDPQSPNEKDIFSL
uniref:low density lipoprotein receptor adapter protein 1-B-like n=2 Tax=Myxine glutinosa TaxID=7769 RepID=UPI00358F2074